MPRPSPFGVLPDVIGAIILVHGIVSVIDNILVSSYRRIHYHYRYCYYFVIVSIIYVFSLEFLTGSQDVLGVLEICRVRVSLVAFSLERGYICLG